MVNILVTTYWSYKDPLIQTYTLPYLKQIHTLLNGQCTIKLLTFEKATIKLSELELQEANIDLKKYNIEVIVHPYSKFGLSTFTQTLKLLFRLGKIIRKENITHIHAWCTQGGAIGYLLSILHNKPLIIDSFEPHAESMVENGTWTKNSLQFKLLFWLEKLQVKKASHIIGLTSQTKQYIEKTYGYSPVNIYTKPACVDLEKFNWSNYTNSSLLKDLKITNEVICLYAGKFGGIYLSNEIFDFFKVTYDYYNGNIKFVILTGNPSEEILNMFKNVSIPSNAAMIINAPHNRVAEYMSIADFAINPVKPVPSKRYCTSIKDGEYWAMGLPVVITANISDDSDIIEQTNSGAVIHQFSTEAYVKAIKQIDSLLKTEQKEELKTRIRTLAIRYRNFSLPPEIYKNIYLTL